MYLCRNYIIKSKHRERKFIPLFFFMVEIPTPSKPYLKEIPIVQIDPKSMRKE